MFGAIQNQPKVWTRDEVIELVLREMLEIKSDARNRGIRWSTRDLADAAVTIMDENGLIEFAPQ